MAARTVFGRVKVNVGGVDLCIEMGRSGVKIRRKHARKATVLGFDTLARFANQQFELFNDTTNETPASESKPEPEVSGVPA